MPFDPKTGLPLDPEANTTNVVGPDGVERVTATGTRRRNTGVFNIANFRSQIDKLGGPARTTLFRVEITKPLGIVQADNKMNSETLSFLTASVNFPAIRTTTHPIQRYGIGPQEDMPTGFVTGSCDMNILGDAEGNVLKFFRSWTRGIVEYQSAKGGILSNASLPNMRPFHVNYKKNFECQITIVIYDVNGNQTYKVSMTKAFPKDIGSVYLSWSNSDQIMYIPISFSYFDLAFDGVNETVRGPEAVPQTMSVIERITSTGAAIQTINDSLHDPLSIGDAINSINNSVNGIRAIGNIFGI